MLKVWNMVLVERHVRARALRHFLTRSGVAVGALLRPVVGRAVLSRVRRVVLASLDGADRLAAAAAARRPPARVGRLPRGDVPLQQPAAARRSRSRCSGASSSRSCARRCGASARRSRRPYYDFFLVIFGLPLLCLIGDRAAHRLAAGVAAQPDTHVPLARRLGPRGRRAPVARGPRVEHRRADGALAVHVRHGHRRPRVRPRQHPPGGRSPADSCRARCSIWSSRNRRRYGGYIVHLAIVILVVGIVGLRAPTPSVDGAPRAGPVHAHRRVHAHRIGASSSGRGPQLHVRVRAFGRRARRDVARRPSSRASASSDTRSDRKRGRHQKQPAVRYRPLLDPPGCRPRFVGRRLRQGACEPRRRACLAGRRRLSARRADHPLAGSARGPPARPPLRRAAWPEAAHDRCRSGRRRGGPGHGRPCSSVAWPFVSAEREGPEQRLSDDDRRRLALAETRDAAYSSLRDLEQDLRTGKVTEADYQAERDRACEPRRPAALRELDQLR